MRGRRLNNIEEAYFGRPRPPEVNPTQFNDLVAQHSDWDPLRANAANFRTHTLKTLSGGSLAYRPSVYLLLFAGAFVLVSIGLLAIYLGGVNTAWYIPLLSGAVFAVSIIIVFTSAPPVRFDKEQQAFVRGWGNQARKQSIPFRDIHALQLLTKISRVSNSSEFDSSVSFFEAYELNLVKNNGTRVYVTDSNRLDLARAEAREIADVLQVPLWDATGS